MNNMPEKSATAPKEQGQAEEKPIVEIFKKCSGRYVVKINGMEIERLRTFSVTVSNQRGGGISEAPFYQIEQYFKRSSF